MKIDELREVLEQIAPTTYRQFGPGEEPELPYIVFYEDESKDVFADNVNIMTIRQMSVEIYADPRDFSMEEKIEKMLTENRMTYKRYAQYLEDQEMDETLYEFEMID